MHDLPPKSAAVRSLITRAVSDSILFKHLDPAALDKLVDAAAPTREEAGATIIRQAREWTLGFGVLG